MAKRNDSSSILGGWIIAKYLRQSPEQLRVIVSIADKVDRNGHAMKYRHSCRLIDAIVYDNLDIARSDVIRINEQDRFGINPLRDDSINVLWSIYQIDTTIVPLNPTE